ncbi:efflux RND transporter periplasmic adaptor subunit [bacterium]|nr:efflux RND transporter periplasmic adaptor subunit [bacterium]
MNKKRRRLGLWIGISAVVAVVALIVILNIVSKGNKSPEVQTQKVSFSRIVSTVSATGELNAKNQVDISAEIVARVQKLYVKEGDAVKRGQLLCQLNDANARSSLDLSEAQYKKALSEFERGRKLYADSLISTAQFENLKTAYSVALAQVNQSRDSYSKTRIYAPISGIVVRLNVKEGEAVMMGTMNNAGTVMMTIADLSAMQATVNVDESDVASIKLGDDASITLDAFPDTTFKAKVFSIGYMPTATTTVTTTTGVTDFETVLDILDVDPLQRPGMSVSADIVAAVRDSALVCPLQAIGRRDIEGRSVETVFIVKNGKAKLVEIKTGISDGRSAEVLDGLEAGQAVIVGPYKVLRTLNDGDEVKTKKEEPQWQKDQRGPRPQQGQESGQRSVRIRVGR